MFTILLLLLLSLLFLQSCNKESDPLLANLQSNSKIKTKELLLLGLFGFVSYKLYQTYQNINENITNLSPPSESCKLSCKGNKCDLSNIPPGNHKEFCKDDNDCVDCMKPLKNNENSENNFGQDGWHMWRNYV